MHYVTIVRAHTIFKHTDTQSSILLTVAIVLCSKLIAFRNKNKLNPEWSKKRIDLESLLQTRSDSYPLKFNVGLFLSRKRNIDLCRQSTKQSPSIKRPLP